MSGRRDVFITTHFCGIKKKFIAKLDRKSIATNPDRAFRYAMMTKKAMRLLIDKCIGLNWRKNCKFHTIWNNKTFLVSFISFFWIQAPLICFLILVEYNFVLILIEYNSQHLYLIQMKLIIFSIVFFPFWTKNNKRLAKFLI